MDNRQSKSDLYFCACVSGDELQCALNKTISLNGRLAVIFTEGGEVTVSLNGGSYNVTETHFFIVPPSIPIRLLSSSPGVSVFIIGFLPALQDLVSKQFSISFFYYVHQHPLWQLTPRQAVEHIKDSLNNGGNRMLFAALGRYTEAVIDDPGFEARVADQLCKMVEQGERNPLMAMMKGFANMMGIANYDEAAHLIRVRLGNIAAALQDEDSRLQKDLSVIF